MYGNNDYRDYLMHFGVKNQKWGVRNGPPYPLNDEGKKKFSDRLAERRKAKKKQEALKKARKTRTQNAEAKKKEEAKIKKSSTALSPTPIKQVKKMSNAELESRIKRLEMEKRLRDLEAGEKSKVRRMVEDALYEGGKQLISTTVKDVGIKYIRDAFDLNSQESKKKDKGNSDNQKEKVRTQKNKTVNINIGSSNKKQNKK